MESRKMEHIEMESRKSWIFSDYISGESLATMGGLVVFGLAVWFTLDTNAFKMVSTNLGSFQNNLANAGKIIGTLITVGVTISSMVKTFIGSRNNIKEKEIEVKGKIKEKELGK